jgi:hypothetical protein
MVHRCDCYIQVEEGLIPAHSVLLCNARTIDAAFASAAQEGTSMIFDMSMWNTEDVLCVIEVLYTQAVEHLKPASSDRVLYIFELLLFLDHPSAHNFLLRVMVSALLTLDARNSTIVRCRNLDPAICQQNIGMLYDEPGVLSATCSQVSFIRVFFYIYSYLACLVFLDAIRLYVEFYG